MACSLARKFDGSSRHGAVHRKPLALRRHHSYSSLIGSKKTSKQQPNGVTP
jgi:hypothetical protein